MRHVNTVRLTARSDALVRRGALLLEDALRTASLPEAGPGRVLLFRTLRLGTISSHLPPASLALLIERLVRALAGSVVHAGDPSAPARDALFFRDDAEPPVALAERLACEQSVSAWFWPLAVPGFHPALPRDEALRLTLSAALRTSAGPAAAVRLVEGLHTRGRLNALLGALRWQEGPELVRAFGGSLPDLPPVAEPSPILDVPAPLRATVSRWARSWGAGDARSLWLSAVALVMGQRGRLADPRLFERAARLAARLTLEPSEDLPWTVRGAEAAPVPRFAPSLQKQASAHAPPETESPPSTPLHAFASSPRPARATAESAPTASVTFREPSREETSRAAPEHLSAPAQSAPQMSAPLPSSPSGSPRDVDHALAPEASQPTEAEAATASELPREQGEWPTVPQPTSLGGLFFLVPVLERLGLSALFEENPSLLELELPERLLALVAERLGAPPTDPSRMLLSASAVTYGAAERSQPSTAPWPPLLGESDPRLLLRGLLTAVRRWCRRHARIGIHSLVHRPARITATRTHVDVVFDIQKVDLRVRRAGLDVDPGWVPWLGRVIRFHYLYGEA